MIPVAWRHLLRLARLALTVFALAVAAAIALWMSPPRLAQLPDGLRVAPATAWRDLNEATLLKRIALKGLTGEDAATLTLGFAELGH